MKPWEEEWTASEDGYSLEAEGGLCLSEITIGPPEPERFRLASAAPDMARVLLAIEWSAQNQYGQAQCPMCRGDEWKDGEPRTGHDENCALLTALIKAGVR